MKRKILIPAIILSTITVGCAKKIIVESETTYHYSNNLEETISETNYQINEKSLTIIVNKSEQNLQILENEEIIKEYAVATGKNSGDKKQFGDLRTPEGEFTLAEPVSSEKWLYEGILAYGPYFFRITGSRWEGIGLHGTKGTVGNPKSHGCIRMKIEDLIEFKEKYYQTNMRIVIKQ